MQHTQAAGWPPHPDHGLDLALDLGAGRQWPAQAEWSRPGSHPPSPRREECGPLPPLPRLYYPLYFRFR